MKAARYSSSDSYSYLERYAYKVVRKRDMVNDKFVYIFSEAGVPPEDIPNDERENLQGMILIEPKERSTDPMYINFAQM